MIICHLNQPKSFGDDIKSIMWKYCLKILYLRFTFLKIILSVDWLKVQNSTTSTITSHKCHFPYGRSQIFFDTLFSCYKNYIHQWLQLLQSWDSYMKQVFFKVCQTKSQLLITLETILSNNFEKIRFIY